jgi:hypothetical protein
MGATGASIIGVAAWRWSRKDEAAPAAVTAMAAGEQDALAERLEDELRDLD